MAADVWQQDVQQLWEQGQRQEAIDQLLTRINAGLPAVPRRLGLQLVYYVWQVGDMAGAERFLRQLQAVHPDDLEILENLAVVLSRQGKAEAALPLFERVAQERPQSANAWDGLAAVCTRLGREAEARSAGERSLALKTEAAPPLADWTPPAEGIAAHLQRPGAAERRNVVAFSIWGANPRYLRGALRNALLVPELYPGWVARFYLDTTVPEAFRTLLQELGAECRLMPADQGQRSRLTWRFLVANDPAVGRFLVRDCDAVVNQREVAAVQAWIASERWFHVMRDWWTHTDPILAGMWGGVAGVLPPLQPLLAAYSPVAHETANVDQWFLRDVLWGSLRHHALIHDRCYRSAGSCPWPQPDPPGAEHVGQDEYAVRRERQALWLAGWLQRYPCLRGESDAPALKESDLAHSVLARWPGPLGRDAVPAMPAGVRGVVLNLPGAEPRWQAMAAQLDRLGWTGSHGRFEAQSASLEEARALGLKGAGELGLWRTTTGLLDEWLAEDPAPDALLHVIEDDAVLHPALPLIFEPLRSHRPPLDLLFSEAFLSRDLFRRFCAMEHQRQQQGEGLWLLNPGQYLACTSSYVLTAQGARRLRKAMEGREQSGSLVPLDMFLRELLRRGELSGSLTLPFFSTVAPEVSTGIQAYRDQAVRLAQDADLCLRRWLYLQAWNPEAGRAVVQELSGVLANGLPLDQLAMLMPDVLDEGRRRGWLQEY